MEMTKLTNYEKKMIVLAQNRKVITIETALLVYRNKQHAEQALRRLHSLGYLALLEFGKSYDSDLLHKSVILLIEGIKSGGELSSLVNNISWNIKETQLLEKEIAAETTTYTVFVVFASLFAAPALYALAHRIILIMTTVTSKIDTSAAAGVITPIPLTIGAQAITSQDFKIFAIVNLFLTSCIYAMMISKIKRGSAKAGLKLIPFFIATSIVLFLILIVILGQLFKGFVI